MKKFKYIYYPILFILLLIEFTACRSSVKKTKKDEDQSKLSHWSDDQLLDTLQRYTFNYFWLGAEPNSGMARERIHMDDIYPLNDKDVVTTGGSGFGLMAILTGIERGYISRTEGLHRFQKAVNFLENADRFHGAWPHWLDGKTGRVKAFSKDDNGGDIVETAFLIQGLLTVKQYFQDGNEEEKELTQQIDKMWREVEWDWYTKNGEDVLYWHWSPNYGWGKNHKIQGYDECLITYILAASSPTHPIDPVVYHKGWARSGDIYSSYTTYGYTMKLKQNGDPKMGGSLFWAHYSFLGLDPRGLIAHGVNYFDFLEAHTQINRQYCIENPHNYKGYGENSWGLTASYSVPGAAKYLRNPDSPKPEKGNSSHASYVAHKPSEDVGVISPTAAISSIVYTPKESLTAIRYFYEELGDSIWGKYGFYDAFSEEYEWFPEKYLAIDQGPIVVMIENYRSQLLWNLFMKDIDVQRGLKRLDFTSPHF